MHSSKNMRPFSAALLAVVVVAARAGAQCTSTDTVIVELACPNVTAGEFNVELHTKSGDQTVTVRRNGKVWSEVVPSFDITGSRLVSAMVPDHRTACDVAPVRDFRVGVKCVAKYVVACDAMWSMKIGSVADGEEFQFKLDPRIAACDMPGRDFETGTTPRNIGDIGGADKVIVAVQRRESYVSVTVTQALLRRYGGTAKFSDLPPLPTTEAPLQGHTRYLKQAQADKNRDLTFTTVAAGGGGLE